MKIIILKDSTAIAKATAKIFIKQINEKPQSVLGFATGSSPIETYALLVKAYQKQLVDFSEIRTFNLDEYIGLGKKHPQSYFYFMKKHLFNNINLAQKNINFPIGVGDILKNIDIYNNLLDNTIIDIQLLGLGINGHIGFNEPGTNFDSTTHKVKLSQNTINTNARFFENEEEVPKYAITMGTKSIMKAKAILLIAYGKNKAPAVKQLIEGELNQKWPCTILQSHQNVTIILDEESASLLNKK